MPCRCRCRLGPAVVDRRSLISLGPAGPAAPAGGSGPGSRELGEIEPLHPRNNTFPGEVFLRVAAGALAWAGVSPADPLPLEGMRERFLPGYSGHGRDRRKLQYAVLAAAALHGGAEPDLLDEVAWWQADDFWQYALLAAVAYVRAAAGRAGVPGARSVQGTSRAVTAAARLSGTSTPSKRDAQALPDAAAHSARTYRLAAI